jgi:hydroxymethylglutaryl-CoA reductase (NADPH)
VPTEGFDYERVMGACCENVVGYMPLPLGIAGPLKVDGELYPIPMATAEGTLVASTSRGQSAERGRRRDDGAHARRHDARPCDRFPLGGARCAGESVDRLGRGVRGAEDGVRDDVALCAARAPQVCARWADAVRALRDDDGGCDGDEYETERALQVLRARFPEMVVLALSGNYCTDKKPAAINWIEGRGKSAVAEAVVPGHVVRSVLKTSVEALCNLNLKKNLVGSAMAGSVGGFNAHAANIPTRGASLSVSQDDCSVDVNSPSSIS